MNPYYPFLIYLAFCLGITLSYLAGLIGWTLHCIMQTKNQTPIVDATSFDLTRTRDALRELIEYAKGNRESREGNPYTKPTVKQAIKVLGEEL